MSAHPTPERICFVCGKFVDSEKFSEIYAKLPCPCGLLVHQRCAIRALQGGIAIQCPLCRIGHGLVMTARPLSDFAKFEEEECEDVEMVEDSIASRRRPRIAKFVAKKMLRRVCAAEDESSAPLSTDEDKGSRADSIEYLSDDSSTKNHSSVEFLPPSPARNRKRKRKDDEPDPNDSDEYGDRSPSPSGMYCAICREQFEQRGGMGVKDATDCTKCQRSVHTIHVNDAGLCTHCEELDDFIV